MVVMVIILCEIEAAVHDRCFFMDLDFVVMQESRRNK